MTDNYGHVVGRFVHALPIVDAVQGQVKLFRVTFDLLCRLPEAGVYVSEELSRYLFAAIIAFCIQVFT